MGKPKTFEQEHELFTKALKGLIDEHGGEFVLWQNDEVFSYYKSFEKAYDEAITKFGLDTPFVLEKVEEKIAAPVSISWEYGVMFG